MIDDATPEGETQGAASQIFKGHIFAPARLDPAITLDVVASTLEEALVLLREQAGEGGQVFGVWDETGTQVSWGR